MKVLQTPLLRNFQINPAFLEKPQTLPFDMPADKKETILSLLLWGLNAYHPEFLSVDHKEIESAARNRHVERIKGVTVDKSTLLSVSVRSEKELRSTLKAGRRIPSLMIVIDYTGSGSLSIEEMAFPTEECGGGCHQKDDLRRQTDR